jgi:hypothetical protein
MLFERLSEEVGLPLEGRTTDEISEILGDFEAGLSVDEIRNKWVDHGEITMSDSDDRSHGSASTAGSSIRTRQEALEEAQLMDMRETEVLGEPPFDAALEWLTYAANGQTEELFTLSTENFRLCRAQGWVWNNRHHPKVASAGSLEDLAARLASGDPACPLLSAFRRNEAQDFHECLAEIEVDALGVGSRRRVVAPGYEIVIAAPLSSFPDEEVIMSPALIGDARQLLMQWLGNRWLLASDVSIAPPTPGFPPAWWSIGSVPEDALHRAATDG